MKNSEENFFQKAILIHRLQLFHHQPPNLPRNNKPPKTLHCFRILSSQTCTHRHQSETKVLLPFDNESPITWKSFLATASVPNFQLFIAFFAWIPLGIQRARASEWNFTCRRHNAVQCTATKRFANTEQLKMCNIYELAGVFCAPIVLFVPPAVPFDNMQIAT